MIQDRGFQEGFARFFESPSRERLREILRTNNGEFDWLDFKEEWPEWSKLARDLLGFANSGGGAIVVGVTNDLVSVGLDELVDKADVSNKIEKYFPPVLNKHYWVLDFSYTDSEYPTIIGKSFQVILIESNLQHLPFIACNTGENIRKAAIYVRRQTKTEEANYEDIQEIINRRIDNIYAFKEGYNLGKDLNQLGRLYDAIEVVPTTLNSAKYTLVQGLYNDMPRESYNEFISKVIEIKKDQIIKAIQNDL